MEGREHIIRIGAQSAEAGKRKKVSRALSNITLKEIGRLMYEHVAAGGDLDEVPETRQEWSDQYEFHHDLRLTIHKKSVYIETRLNCRLPVVPDESWILVVNIHER